MKYRGRTTFTVAAEAAVGGTAPPTPSTGAYYEPNPQQEHAALVLVSSEVNIPLFPARFVQEEFEGRDEYLITKECSVVHSLGLSGCLPTTNQLLQFTDWLRAHVQTPLTSERTDVSIVDLHDKVGYSGIPSDFKTDV